MSTSFLVGLLFAVAGFALFLAQILTVELARAYRHLYATIHHHYGHDTAIFPDHHQIEQPEFKFEVVRNSCRQRQRM